MIRKNEKVFNLINMISDGLIVFLSYFLVLILRFDVMKGHVSIELRDGNYIAVMFVYSVLVVCGYYVLHMYRPKRLAKMGSGNTRILIVNTVGVLLMMTLMYVFRLMDVSRLAVFLFWMMTNVLVIAKHMGVHLLLRYSRAKGYNLKHFLLVGSGYLAGQYLEDVSREPSLGICIDGYVGELEKEELGKRLGRYEDLEEILVNGHFDGMVVALEANETHHMKRILNAADKEGMFVQMIPFFNEFYPAHPTFDLIGNTKLINLRATPLDSIANAFIKRTMDIVGSLVLLILGSPVLLAIAIGVKLSSPGPVFFKQERIGRNKRPFYMHKFRSMRIDVDHEGWTTHDDPRKTRFGSFIRKYSLDELPQLFDVLVGNMSLVGPRPEIPRFVRQFKEEISLYLVRQQVRPGMTGWAQVHGLRGDTSIEERVKYDIWYIENWSLSLDIRILLKTAFGGMVNKEVLAGTARKEEASDHRDTESEKNLLKDEKKIS